MKFVNTGIDSVKHDLQELVEGAQAERGALLGRLREAQLAARLLIQAEGQRLAKRAPNDPRLPKLAAIDRVVRERIGVLDTEVEIAAIRIPAVTRDDALVHGRVSDSAQRAAGDLTAVLVRADGTPVEGVAPVAVDAFGYYAFVVGADRAAAIGTDAKLSVQLKRDDASVTPASAAGFTLGTAKVAVRDVVLSDSELSRLHLRADVGATLRTTARPARATPVKRAKPAKPAKPAKRAKPS